MGDTRFTYRVLLGRDIRERDHLEDTGISGRIILRWISGKWDLWGMDWIDLVQDWGQVVGIREGGYELSGSIKCGEFLTSVGTVCLSGS
jgi:hypothetical protein